MKNKNDDRFLVLKRFCGEEKYPIMRAEWYIMEGDGTWDDPYTLCLEMDFGKGIDLHEDTKTLKAEPGWEISFPALKLSRWRLLPGFSMKLENDEEDEDAIFYYCEHQATVCNKVKVLKIWGNSLLLHITAKTEDVNFYDGSKPKNELELTAWFTKQED